MRMVKVRMEVGVEVAYIFAQLPNIDVNDAELLSAGSLLNFEAEL